MTEFAPISKSDLAERRRSLRQKRRWRLLQHVWRVLALSGLTGGVLWTLTSSGWVLRSPQQIEIQGNEVIPTETIQALLPLDYPEFMFRIQPQAIATYLEAQTSIAEAQVTRHIFPPQLSIQIQERHPVAILVQSGYNHRDETNPTERLGHESALLPSLTADGLIDEKGFFMSLENYISLHQSSHLPDLTLLGMQSEYRSQWEQLYQDLQRQSVDVSIVDWREPGNLILTTELGIVHLGAYTPRFLEQMQVLAQMQNLPGQLESDQLEFIDLRDPSQPLIQLRSPRNPATASPQTSSDSTLDPASEP